jgi:DUF4097 and DUF4098 domain-containing protein YvlB
MSSVLPSTRPAARGTSRSSARLLIRLFAVALIGTGGSGAAHAKSWTFEVSAGELLEVDLEPGGDVEIRGERGSTVTVQTVGRRDDDENEFQVTAIKTDRGVRVKAEMEHRYRSHSVDVGILITVPEQFDLDLESSGGGFRVVGVEGTIEGETQGGSLELERVRGRISMETMGGSIVARDVEADGKLETMGGSLDFVDVRGGLEGSTMGGKVTLEGGDRVRLTTMGGSVRVKSAPEGAKVSTMGGDIEVDSAHAPFEATTMGGDLSARIDGGEGDVELESMGGDVEVWLPAGFSAEFDVEIVQTRGRDGAYTIESDFELERKRERRRATFKGDYEEETVWRGVGRSGSGAHRVTLSTVNGDIRIRRAG